MSAEAVVYVVDDEEGVRDSLSCMLQALMLNVKSYGSAFDFLSAYDSLRPGCLVLDVRMPDISGLELQDILIQRGIRIPVIMMSGHGDISIAVTAMKKGALDFIEKPLNHNQMVERIQQGLAADLCRKQEMSHYESAIARLNTLTPRESEVLDCIVRGLPNKLIASELGISIKTVEVHRARVMYKMKVSSVAELTTLFLSANGHSGNSSSLTNGSSPSQTVSVGMRFQAGV